MSDIEQSPESEDVEQSPAAAEQAETAADAVLGDTSADPSDVAVPPTAEAVADAIDAVAGTDEDADEVADSRMHEVLRQMVGS